MAKKEIDDYGDQGRIPSDKTDPAFADSEYIKKKYFYRTLIVKGRAKVKNSGTTRRLVGPDCAYHLYGSAYMDGESVPENDSGQDTGNSID